jgi:hypothetical protein
MDAIDEVGPDRGRVCAALSRTKDHPSLIGPITFNAKGQNVTVPISAYRAEGGAWRRIGGAGANDAEPTDPPIFFSGDPKL